MKTLERRDEKYFFPSPENECHYYATFCVLLDEKNGNVDLGHLPSPERTFGGTFGFHSPEQIEEFAQLLLKLAVKSREIKSKKVKR